MARGVFAFGEWDPENHGGASLRRWCQLRDEWTEAQQRIRALYPSLDLVVFLIPIGDDEVHFVYRSADPDLHIEDVQVMTNAQWAAQRDDWKRRYYALLPEAPRPRPARAPGS